MTILIFIVAIILFGAILLFLESNFIIITKLYYIINGYKILNGTRLAVDFRKQTYPERNRIICSYPLAKKYEKSVIFYLPKDTLDGQFRIFPMRFGALHSIDIQKNKVKVHYSSNPIEIFAIKKVYFNGRELSNEEVFNMKNMERQELVSYSNLMLLKDEEI